MKTFGKSILLCLCTMLTLTGKGVAGMGDDLTHEEWFERYQRYLGGGSDVCKNGYLDFALTGLNKVTRDLVVPSVTLIVTERTRSPILGRLSGLALEFAATWASNEYSWLCRCVPVTRNSEIVHRDADGNIVLTEERELKTRCCTLQPAMLHNPFHPRCQAPEPSIEQCIAKTEAGGNICFR
ncbi:MAG: hypothetical protein QHI48_05860 [Bacteroidota bacterium]|nr:hypothetical protein [Bacteroidota bacterium]